MQSAHGSHGALLLYTDGSFSPPTHERAALLGWAVAAFQLDAEEGPAMECLGILADSVPDCFIGRQ